MMMSPNDARSRLHALIDMLPDEQVSLVWMAFQGMLNTDLESSDDDDEDDEEMEQPDIDTL